MKFPFLLRRIEDALLVMFLVALLVLSASQITARNLFDGGWIWGDQLVRVLVLWVGLLGAVVASRENYHLRVDILPRVLAHPARNALAVFTHLFTAAVCGLVSWHAYRFVADERTFGAIGIAGIPGWVLAIVIPLSFGLMALRHLAHCWHAVHTLVRGAG